MGAEGPCARLETVSRVCSLMRMDAGTVRGRMFAVCALVQCPDMLVMRTVRAGHGVVLFFVRGCRCDV